jgi:hypothetical protein
MKSPNALTFALVLVLCATPLASCGLPTGPPQTEAQRRSENEPPAGFETAAMAVTGARIYTGGAAVSATTTTMHAAVSVRHSVLSEDQVQTIIVLVTKIDIIPICTGHFFLTAEAQRTPRNP